MITSRIARLAVLVALLTLAAPMGYPATSAVAQEQGATLLAYGTTTVTVGGQEIAALMQDEAIMLVGTEYQPGEMVGIWVTYADGSVYAIFPDDTRADDEGNFTIELWLGSWLPVGLHRFSARGASSVHGAIVPFYLLPGAAPATTSGTEISVSPATAQQLDAVTLTGRGFMAGEDIALWLTQPDGIVIGLGRFTAGEDGTFSLEIFLAPFLPVGRHAFTARGLNSDNTAITGFRLEYGNGLGIPGATLAADIGRLKQRMVVDVYLEGLAAEEIVSFWLTLPDGSVWPLGDAQTDGDGSWYGYIYLGEYWPVGTHYLSFMGNTSFLAGFAKVALEAGPTAPGEE
jgi:hypothetical protein